MRVARPNRRYQAALWIDRRLGPLLCALLVGWRQLFRAPAPLPPPESVKKILVLKLWGMGLSPVPEVPATSLHEERGEGAVLG